MQHTRVSNIVSNSLGRHIVMGSNLAPLNSSHESLLNPKIYSSLTRYPPPVRQENNDNNNNNNARLYSININNIPIMSPSSQEHSESHHDNRQKTIMLELIAASVNEMIELLHMNHPIWVDSTSDGRCFIHHESYEGIFPQRNRPYKSATTRIESSRDSGIVPMTAVELINNFIDPVSFLNAFML